MKGIGGENVYYDIAFKKEANAHILGYLCLGEQAKIYGALGSEKAIINKLLEQLDKIYDGKASGIIQVSTGLKIGVIMNILRHMDATYQEKIHLKNVGKTFG